MAFFSTLQKSKIKTRNKKRQKSLSSVSNPALVDRHTTAHSLIKYTRFIVVCFQEQGLEPLKKNEQGYIYPM